MAIVIIPPPTLAGGGDVTGGGDLNNANRVVIVAGTAEVGESDVSLASGIFSRAGTVGLSATGANVVTVATNGVERVRVDLTGNIGFGTSPRASTRLDITGGDIAIAGGSAASSWQLNSLTLGYYATTPYSWIQSGGAAVGTILTLNPLGGNVLIGTTTDDGSSKLQVAGTITGYDATIYDPTAVTGSSTLVVRAGAGQSTGAMLNIFENDGTTSLLRVEPTKIGFFGAAPVAQQVEGAGDAAAIITALKNLGLMAP